MYAEKHKKLFKHKNLHMKTAFRLELQLITMH
jgi:hypothetical protein